MPSNWEWWAGYHRDVEYEGAYNVGCFLTRQEAIDAGRAEMPDRDGNSFFHIIEARSSTDKRYEGDDFVPFTHSRNAEIIDAGQAEPDAQKGN